MTAHSAGRRGAWPALVGGALFVLLCGGAAYLGWMLGLLLAGSGGFAAGLFAGMAFSGFANALLSTPIARDGPGAADEPDWDRRLAAFLTPSSELARGPVVGAAFGLAVPFAFIAGAAAPSLGGDFARAALVLCPCLFLIALPMHEWGFGGGVRATSAIMPLRHFTRTSSMAFPAVAVALFLCIALGIFAEDSVLRAVIARPWLAAILWTVNPVGTAWMLEEAGMLGEAPGYWMAGPALAIGAAMLVQCRLAAAGLGPGASMFRRRLADARRAEELWGSPKGTGEHE